MEQQLVIFNLDEEFYGLDISRVEGIIKLQAITKMPKAPAIVEGITNLRGMVVPVIDLRKRFGLSAAVHSKDTRIVIIHINQTKVGMMVDGVSEVLRIPEETIEPTPPLITSEDTTFILGIAKFDDRLITLLDVDQVLSNSDVAAIEKLTARIPAV